MMRSRHADRYPFMIFFSHTFVELRQLYSRLMEVYGPQNWWPAETPFEVVVGAVLTQNTAWRNVEKAIGNLKREGLLDPESILRTPDDVLRELIRPAGFYNQKVRRLKAVCKLIVGSGGLEELFSLPLKDLRDTLLSVKGIGPETADAIILYAANKPTFVVDRYTHRIFTRLGIWDGNYDYDGIKKLVESEIPPNVDVYKEFHAVIDEHAKRICRKRPFCSVCPLRDLCPYATSVAASDSADTAP